MPASFTVNRAWNKIHRSARTDQLAPLGGVLFRQQNVSGNLAEARVAVVGVAVRIRELQCFHGAMDVLGGFKRLCLHIEAFQNIERLEQRGALTPEPWLVYLETAIISGCGLFRLQPERSHVLVTQQSAIVSHECVNLVRDLT